MTRKEFLLFWGTLLVALVPVVALLKKLEEDLFAASPWVASEAESGTLTNGATKVANSATSGGQYVQFSTASTGSGTAGFGQNIMNAPISVEKSYVKSDMMFNDTFSGTSLDLTKWWPRLGSGGTWNDFGNLPSPFSGANEGQFECEVMNPSQLQINNGLTIIGKPNPYLGTGQHGAAQDSYYKALTGIIQTYCQDLNDGTGSTARLTMPTGGWYVQVNVKIPDVTQGLNGSLWFLPANGTGASGGDGEIDMIQPGLNPGASNLNACPLGTGFFSSAGNPYKEQVGDYSQYLNGGDAHNTFNIYGVQWIPGVSLRGYINGHEVWTILNKEIPGGITSTNYQLMMHIIAWDPVNTAGWAVPYKGGSSNYEIAEVQIYKF